MSLDNVQGTQHTPALEVLAADNLKIIGRSFPEDVSRFYNPIIDHVRNLACEKLTLDIFLDYFNTASSKKIMDVFRYADANNGINRIEINWRYEEGDDDSLEMAEIYEESLLKSNFKYIEVAETMLV